MRLLYVLERYPELSQTFVSSEIRGLIELGCEVKVVALAPGRGGERPAPVTYASDASKFARISSSLKLVATRPIPSIRQLAAESSWPPQDGRQKLRGMLRIAPWTDTAREADHIHAHFATEAADIARLLSASSGTPFSFSAHATDAYSDPLKLGHNIRESSFVRAVAPHISAQLISAAPECAGRIHEIPAAINDDRFTGTGHYESQGPVIAVGRLVAKKGFDDLITASSMLKTELGNRKVLIAGEGPERERLEQMIISTGAPVTLLGSVANAELPKLLARGSLFVAPSKLAHDGDRDGRPAALAEAMAVGLPVVSTTLPGIPGLVDSGHGVLVEPGNPDQLAAAIAGMIARPSAERAAIGRAAADHAASIHGYRAVARMMLDLFNGRGGNRGSS
ncbi:MAG: glycosyltransferase family 4 protein [Solirubrobacterales bacterium]|nr:glycosyltransferase family 4 protein [Solirubrobacterales bacterium]